MTKQSDNLALWDVLGKTDPAHTKRFKRAGGFEGTALKPSWCEKLLTQQFGPCGIGWGFDPPEYRVVDGANKEVLVFCNLTAWYRRDGEVHHLFGNGGDKIVKYSPPNDKYKRGESWSSNDEAFKMASTDALMNAFKHVGLGADIHMGQFDDNKYVAEVAREFEQQAEPEYAMPKDAHDRLAALLRDSGVSASALFKEYKVRDLRALDARQYQDAVDRLTAKLAEKSKAETNAAQPADSFGELLEDEVPY